MKKFLAVLLALVMVLSLFAGCSSKSSKKKSSSKNRDDDDDKETTSETGSTDGTGSTDSTKGNNKNDANGDKETTAGTGAPSDNDDDDEYIGNPTFTTPTTSDDQPNGGVVRPYPGATTPTTPGNNSGTGSTVSGVPVGTVLNAPEKAYTDTGKIYIDLYMDNNGTEQELEISFVAHTGNTNVLYVKVAKTEIIIEKSASGYAAYAGDATHPFTKDTATSQAQLQSIFNQYVTILGYFTNPQNVFGASTYRKSSGNIPNSTGPVYVYDVLNNGTAFAQVCIDQETGLVVYMKNPSKNVLFIVNDFATDYVSIPKYK